MRNLRPHVNILFLTILYNKHLKADILEMYSKILRIISNFNSFRLFIVLH